MVLPTQKMFQKIRMMFIFIYSPFGKSQETGRPGVTTKEAEALEKKKVQRQMKEAVR